MSSDWEPVTLGFFQGSILRPLLLLIYVNDNPTVSKRLEVFLFADDTNIIACNRNLIDFQHTSSIHGWLISNKLTSNTDETTFVSFKHNSKSF